MVKTFNQKTLLTLIISVTLLIAIYPCSFAAADSPSVQEKAFQLLGDVADVNLAAYAPSFKPVQAESYLSLDKQTSEATLVSADSSFRVRYSFVGDRLQMLFVSHKTGEVALNSFKAASVVEDAKGFLSRYQVYSNDSFYGSLNSMLDDMPVDNASKTQSDLRLDVDINLLRTEFVWTYVDASGVEAPVKNVALTYEDGSLKSFVDNWQFYTVMGEPKVSSEQAVDLALATTANFSYASPLGGNVTVSGFKVASVGNASLCYLNYQETDLARGGDPFTLYPAWFVPIGFDRVYPGGVSGVYVRLWADMGEIKEIVPMVIGQEAGVSDDFSEAPVVVEPTEIVSDAGLQMVHADFTLVSVVLVASFCVLGICLRSRLAGLVGVARLPRWRFKPLTGLLCVLMVSSLVLVFVPSAEAYLPNQSAGSLVFGSRYQQFNDWSDGTYFDEPGAVNEVTNAVYNYFVNSPEYDSTSTKKELDSTQNPDVPSTNFTKSVMLSDITYMRQNYDTFCALYIGHMNGTGNYWFDNSTGENNVRWEDIEPLTYGKTFFAWSWTCFSATGRSEGLARGWFGTRLYSSSSTCYLGFNEASPALSARSFNSSTGLGKEFITHFYYYALMYEYTVYDSLDEASWDVFGVSYANSPLTDFSTYWPVYSPGIPNTPGWHEGSMNIFGNPNIYLIERMHGAPPSLPQGDPTVTIVASYWDQEYEMEMFLSVPFYIGGYIYYSGWDVVPIYQNFLPAAVYEVYVPEYLEAEDMYFCDVLVSGNYYTSVPFIVDARYSTQQISVLYGFGVNVTAGEGGGVSPSGLTVCSGLPVEISATPNQGWAFDYWTLNDQYYSSESTLEFVASESCELHAVFAPCYTLTVQYGEGGYASADGSTYVNGSLATVTAYPDEDYLFDYWTVNQTIAGSNSTLQLIMDANYTVTAHFLDVSQLPTCHLTVQTQGPGSAYSSSYLYLEDDVATVYASANGGCTFIGWTVDGNPAGLNSTLTVTMDANHTVVAMFAYDWAMVDFYLTAMYGFYQPVTVDLTIDGNYVGTTVGNHRVTEGYHSLEVPDAIYVSGSWHYFIRFSLTTDFGMLLESWTGNPASVFIEDQTYSGNLYIAEYT
ncbi:MAG: hypothetical protein NWF01_02550 [Candidatus Bathyarchaeota archaeon]|nr:hypothetical protein [Candidatus Bathyarchaeota archaeon]